MSLRLTISTSKLSERARLMTQVLTAKAPMYEAIGGVAEAAIRDYIIAKAPSVHTTANRLGTTRYTQHYEAAAASVAWRTVAVGQEVTGATLSLTGEIFKRTTRAVPVAARIKKWLTIAASAASYGRRAREFPGLKLLFFGRFLGLGIPGVTARKGGRKGKDGQIQEPRQAVPARVFYWLKKAVTLPQDRTLLPSDEEFLGYAERGITLAWIRQKKEAVAS